MANVLLHIGKKRVQTLTASDGSVIPPGTVTATAQFGNVSVSVDPVTNAVTVTGISTVEFCNVNYSAPGYLGASQTFQVAPLPNLIVTDGPEQLV